MKPYMLVLLLGTCGCFMDPSKLISTPAFSLDTPSGWRVRATTDAVGKADYTVDPTTGVVTFHLDMSSAASPVVTAEGERAAMMVEVYKVSAANNAAMVQALGGIVQNLASQLIPLAAPRPPGPAGPPEPSRVDELTALLERILASEGILGPPAEPNP